MRRKARREAGKYRIEIQEDKKERRQGGKKNKKTCEEGGLVGGTIEDGQRKRGVRGREREQETQVPYLGLGGREKRMA